MNSPQQTAVWQRGRLSEHTYQSEDPVAPKSVYCILPKKLVWNLYTLLQKKVFASILCFRNLYIVNQAQFFGILVFWNLYIGISDPLLQGPSQTCTKPEQSSFHKVSDWTASRSHCSILTSGQFLCQTINETLVIRNCMKSDFYMLLDAPSRPAVIYFHYLPGSTFSLKWFTPRMQLNICGHATLASVAVIFNVLGRSYAFKVRRFAWC